MIDEKAQTAALLMLNIADTHLVELMRRMLDENHLDIYAKLERVSDCIEKAKGLFTGEVSLQDVDAHSRGQSLREVIVRELDDGDAGNPLA